MSNQNGYCLAYRKAWTHDAFSDLLEAAIWNYLYQNAFYEDGERNFNGVVIQLKRGQIAITPRFLAKGFRISESNARRVIEKLIKLKSIEKQTTTKATIITICNYDKFQLSQKTNDEQKESKRRPNDANNNKIIKEINTPQTPQGDFNFLKWNGIRVSMRGSAHISEADKKYFAKHKEVGEQQLKNNIN